MTKLIVAFRYCTNVPKRNRIGRSNCQDERPKGEEGGGAFFQNENNCQ